MLSWNSSSYVQVYYYILLISLFWTENLSAFFVSPYKKFFHIHLESLLNLDFDPTIKVDIKQPSRKRLNYLEVFFCCPNNFYFISISYLIFFLFLSLSFFYCQKSSEFLVLGIIRTRNRLRNAVLQYIKLPCYTKTHGKHSSFIERSMFLHSMDIYKRQNFHQEIKGVFFKGWNNVHTFTWVLFHQARELI